MSVRKDAGSWLMLFFVGFIGIVLIVEIPGTQIFSAGLFGVLAGSSGMMAFMRWSGR